MLAYLLSGQMTFLNYSLWTKDDREIRNLRKEHVQNVGFFNTQKDLQREMGKHRRELLSKVAQVYKAEKSEFYQKYRIF